MFKNYYKVKVSGKDVRRFIKMLYKLGVFLEEVEVYEYCCYIKVDEESYKKLCEVKTSYNIELIDLFGFKKIEMFFKKNVFLILSFILGIVLLFFLSNLIFDIEVIHSDSDIRKLILKELEENDIKKYVFMKDYDYIQGVKEKILKNNKDSIEWLEIERVGTKYKVRVEKRIINDINDSFEYKHIVAKKSGIIMRIKAESGEVVKKINDYVKEGDIIISGSIYRNGNVVNNVEARGEVFGEVWYSVKVEMPKDYKEEVLTGNSDKFLSISFLDNDINLFGNVFEKNNIKSRVLFKDFFNMFVISYNDVYEVEVSDDDVSSLAINYARGKIIDNLRDGEYIISQKKLKTTVNNSTISVEIFFKVYENISDLLIFSVEEGT